MAGFKVQTKDGARWVDVTGEEFDEKTAEQVADSMANNTGRKYRAS